MGKDIKITHDDMRLADKFCQAINECQLQDKYDCISKLPIGDAPCLNCKIASFKLELIAHNQSFWGAWKQSLESITLNSDRVGAIYHLFLGIGALYSANQRTMPYISDKTVEEIGARLKEGKAMLLREITDDLKSFGDEWYEAFFSAWDKFHLSDQIWINNIILLKIFLEGIRQERLINDLQEFLKKERQKPKDEGAQK